MEAATARENRSGITGWHKIEMLFKAILSCIYESYTMSVVTENNHEYYLNEREGYALVSAKEIIEATLVEDEEDGGYHVCEHTPEMFARVVQKFEKTPMRPILIMSMTVGTHTSDLIDMHPRVYIKAALRNEYNDKIVFVNSSNRVRREVKRIEKPECKMYPTRAEGWSLMKKRMSAPIPFWRELQKRLCEEEERRRADDFTKGEKLFFVGYLLAMILYLVVFRNY